MTTQLQIAAIGEIVADLRDTRDGKLRALRAVRNELAAAVAEQAQSLQCGIVEVE